MLGLGTLGDTCPPGAPGWINRANEALECPPECSRLGGPPERSEGGEGARMAGPLRAPLSKASANYIIQEIAPDLGDAPLFGHCKCRPVLEPGHCNVQCRRLRIEICIPQSPNLTWSIDGDPNSRRQFQTVGNLSNVLSTSFGPMGPKYVTV